MPTGLDEFNRYLEQKEKARGGEAAAATLPAPDDETRRPPAVVPETGEESAEPDVPRPPRRPAMMPLPGSAEPGVRYVLRGGVTVAVPAEEAPVLPEKPTLRPPLRRAPAPPPDPAPAAPLAEHRNEPEAAPPAAPAKKAAPEPAPAAAAATEYIPPIIEAHEPTQVADAPTRPRAARKAEDADDPLFSDADILELWQTLPRHIQLLVGMKTEEQEEVAQKYYTRNFKESRAQLIERLLDPTLTLEDTARVLGVCPTTVRRYTNRNVLPHYRTVGQQRRFRLSDVLAFLERQQRARRRRAEKTAAVLAGRGGAAPSSAAADDATG